MRFGQWCRGVIIKALLFMTAISTLLPVAGAKMASTQQASLVVFLSLSMPPKSIKAWLLEAQKAHASVVLRGLKANSFKKTLAALKPYLNDASEGVQINPILFQQFGIDRVPAVAQVYHTNPPQAAIVYGDVPLASALSVLKAHAQQALSLKSHKGE